MAMWQDDPKERQYKGIYIVPENIADTMDDFGQAHYLEVDRTYTRIEYAARAGLKVIGPNYLLLIRIEMQNDRIGWMIMITSSDVHDIFPDEIDENE
jgi:hypothetical protein